MTHKRKHRLSDLILHWVLLIPTILRFASNLTRLIKVKLRLAGKNLIHILIFSLLAVMLIMTIWISLLAFLFVYLMSLHYTLVSSLLIILISNVLLFLFCCFRIMKAKKMLYRLRHFR